MSALCAALTFPTPRGTQITPLITSLPWEALLDGTHRAAPSSQTPPGAPAPEKHLHFPLLLRLRRFLMTQRSLRPTRGAGDGGLSTTLSRQCHPLLSQPVLGLVRQFGLCGSCPGGVFRPKELPVASFTSIKET